MTLLSIIILGITRTGPYKLADLWNHFLLGGIVAMCIVAGLKFLLFWRRTHDRLFLIFAIAFWTLGANWLGLAILNQDEVRTALYVVRLLAFLLILWGIIDKNRAPTSPSPAPGPSQ